MKDYRYDNDKDGDHLDGPYNKINQIEAVKVIEKCWCSFRDKQMFRLLKHTICAAEHSLSAEIIKKIAPLESNILNDPCVKVRIKFRFSGLEFPPSVVFKIYSQMQDGKSAMHISGKDMIKPASSAAQEACNQMGNKQYYNLMIFDSLQNVANKRISEKSDVVSIRDYMQYSSLVDDLPAYLGGRSNAWRRLNLTDLPRHTIFYDVMNYAVTKKMSKKLLREMPVLMKFPKTQEIQLQQIIALSILDLPSEVPANLSANYLRESNYKDISGSSTSRRSKKVVTKVSQMKKAYSLARSETVTTENGLITENNTSGRHSDSFKMPDDLNDDFENEVKNLYLWTQNLSTTDDLVN